MDCLAGMQADPTTYLQESGTHDNCHLVLGMVDQHYKLAYEPGSTILFRSAIGIHGITDDPDDRMALILFSHKDALKWQPQA